MSRNIKNKSNNTAVSASTKQNILRTSLSPKSRPVRIASRNPAKSPTPVFLQSNCKISDSSLSKPRNIKIRNNTTAESGLVERPDNTQSSLCNSRYKERAQKSVQYYEKSHLTCLSQKSNSRVGNLAKKLSSENNIKGNLTKRAIKGLSNKREKCMNILNQETFQNALERREDLKHSRNLSKTVEAFNLKKRQQKLYESLSPANQISEQNNLKHQNIHFQSLTGLSGNASSYISRHGSQKFAEIEKLLDNELNERKEKPYQLDKREKLFNQEHNISNEISKAHKHLEEKNKFDSSGKSTDNPETSESLNQASSPGLRNYLFSRKTSNSKENFRHNEPCREDIQKDFIGFQNNFVLEFGNEQSDPYSNLNVKNCLTFGENRKMSPQTLARSGNNYSLDELIKRKEISMNLPYTSVEIKAGITSPTISCGFGHGSREGTFVQENRSFVSPTNINKRHWSAEKLEKEYREGIGAMKEEPFFKEENKKDFSCVLNIDKMNVKQLIELKNIIEDRIEVEELKNKAEHLRTSPTRQGPKIQKSLKDQEYQKKVLLEKSQTHEEDHFVRSNSVAEKIKKSDIYGDKIDVRRQSEETVLMQSKQKNSLSSSCIRGLDHEKKYQPNRANPYPTSINYESKAQPSSYSSEKVYHDFNHQNNGEFKNIKVKEFLALKEAKGNTLEESYIRNKSPDGDLSKAFAKKKKENVTVSFNNYVEVNSEDYNGFEIEMLKRREREPTASCLTITEPTKKESLKEKFYNNYETKDFDYRNYKEEKATSMLSSSLFSKPEGSINRKLNLTVVTKDFKKDFEEKNLIQILEDSERRERNRASTSNPRSRNSSTKLTKKDINNIIEKANYMVDTPGESADDYIKKIVGYEVNGMGSEPKGLTKVLNSDCAIQDETSSMETPSSNLKNFESKSSSSLLETDLSVIAITKKIMEMKSAFEENK